MIEVTTDRARMDVSVVHRFLSEESYWAKAIPPETLERAIEHSLPFAALEGDALVAFARVITDQATFAYLADVFVLRSHRGRGIARQLLQTILDDPRLQGLRRWHLVTRDAHPLYAAFGFVALEMPERHMQKLRSR